MLVNSSCDEKDVCATSIPLLDYDRSRAQNNYGSAAYPAMRRIQLAEMTLLYTRAAKAAFDSL